jgi:hypothetical protein
MVIVNCVRSLTVREGISRNEQALPYGRATDMIAETSALARA